MRVMKYGLFITRLAAIFLDLSSAQMNQQNGRSHTQIERERVVLCQRL